MRPMSRRQFSGFAMLEVLVTLLILLLGLLGVAGILMRSQEAAMESYQRTQAILLAQDMLARLNANRQVAPCYAITTAGATPYLGTGGVAVPACGAGTPQQQTLAQQDLQAWSNLLQGAAETTAGGNAAGAMLGARGCIAFDAATQTYAVTVAWQGLNRTVAPAAATPCAQGLYGDDAQRRVVVLTLQIANL